MAGLQNDRHRYPGGSTTESAVAAFERRGSRTCTYETFITCPFCESDFSIDVHRDTAVSGRARRYPAGIGTAAGARMGLPSGITWWVAMWWVAYALALGVLVFTGIIWF